MRRAALALVLGAFSAATAQQARRPPAPKARVTGIVIVDGDSTPRTGAIKPAPGDSTPRDSTMHDPGDEREVAAVVVTAAAPRSFRVVSVSLPPDLAGAGKVSYEVAGTGAVSLLGAHSGTVSRSGVVVVTVGVPASAGAGRTRAGVVRFVASGRQPVRAPIDIDVPPIAHIEVTPTQAMRGARPGDRVELGFNILNAGNLTDTLDLELDAPAAWNARITGAPRPVLRRGESVDRLVTAAIPIMADLGDVAITLIVHSHAGDRAVASSIVEVTDPLRAGRRPGPIVTIGAASALSAGLPSRAVESVAIDGPLTDAVTISGRLSTPMPTDLVDGRALSTLGYNSQANFMSLAAPNWGGTVGTTGLALGDLAGQNVFGRGASLRVGPLDERLELFGASPLAAEVSPWSTPTLFAATGEKQVGPGMITAFFSHLRDSTYYVRSVDAAGATLGVQPWTNAYAFASVAERSYRNGNGVGAEADFRGPIAGGDASFRFTHAPGGTSAFAPARDAASFAADRTFGRLRTNVSYWSTQDDNAARIAIGSTGWSLSPTWAAFSTFTLGADLLHTTVTSRDSVGGFGSAQTDYGVRARLLRGGFDIGADTRLSNIAQSVADSLVSIEDASSRRVINRLRIDRVGSRGAIGVSGSIETASFGVTAAPPQSAWDAHLDRFQFWPRFPRWTISAMSQHLRYGQAAVTTSRGELDVDVLGSLRIALGAERGTARDALGLLHTVFTIKVERSSNVSALDRRVTTGVVFQDRNGNGVRDPGEQGVAGIVVHRGSETAVTDASGEYRMNSAGTGRVEVDDRSLPKGWVQSPRMLDRSYDGLELGVIPITALDVRLDLATNPDGSSPAVRIGVATLTLHDSTGREWIVRADGALHATFDALPAGRYMLTTELDGSSEPLTIDPTPAIEVGAAPGGSRQRVVVTVRARPVRVFKTKQQVEKRDRSGS